MTISESRLTFNLLIRINIHIKLKRIQNRIKQDNERLDAMVLKKTREVAATRDITIQALVGLLEVRNVESSKHTIRTQLIMKNSLWPPQNKN